MEELPKRYDEFEEQDIVEGGQVSPQEEDEGIEETEEGEPGQISALSDLNHKSFVIIGTKGSGKTTLAKHITDKVPYCLFLNPQEFPMPDYKQTDTENWEECIREHKHCQIQITHNTDMEKLITDWHESSIHTEFPEQGMICVDESNSLGLKSKLSTPVFARVLFMKHRRYYNICLIAHTAYMLPAWLLSNTDYILFMRIAVSAQEWDYVTRWWSELDTPEYQDILSKRYYFVVYDTERNQYYAFEPISPE